MNDSQGRVWGDLFIEATQAILDALSHVDEFDMHSFLSSVLAVSSKEIEDVDSKVARFHAEEFIKRANELIKLLMSYKPNDEKEGSIYSWWRSDDQYNRACTRIKWLNSWVDVVDHLQLSINALSGDEFKTTRQGLLAFKKECIEAINGLNLIIETYNRFTLPKSPNYKLDSIIYK